MEYQNAVLTVTLWGNAEKTFQNVTASVEFPDAEIHRGVDSAARIRRAGTLRVRLPEFAGWHSAVLLEIDGDLFEVSKTFSEPRLDGDWLEFPVLRR
ncbi:MAG: hypothetical protein CML01_13710 [Pseudomonas sp.]|nr:hypothetical protein [Pseudomonas sp.]